MVTVVPESKRSTFSASAAVGFSLAPASSPPSPPPSSSNNPSAIFSASLRSFLAAIRSFRARSSMSFAACFLRPFFLFRYPVTHSFRLSSSNVASPNTSVVDLCFATLPFLNFFSGVFFFFFFDDDDAPPRRGPLPPPGMRGTAAFASRCDALLDFGRQPAHADARRATASRVTRNGFIKIILGRLSRRDGGLASRRDGRRTDGHAFAGERRFE